VAVDERCVDGAKEVVVMTLLCSWRSVCEYSALKCLPLTL
jgi:hypothetical protein